MTYICEKSKLTVSEDTHREALILLKFATCPLRYLDVGSKTVGRHPDDTVTT
jgi:hypothetical protein